MIIFGWRRILKELGLFGPALCPNCHNNAQFRHLMRRKWFTLFFIPVIPVQTEYLLLCQVCSKGWALKEGQAPEGLLQQLPQRSVPPMTS